MEASIINAIASFGEIGKIVVRFGIVVVFLWIGGLKFYSYEADGIVPFVANSPFMSFFYRHPESYKTHKNKEGEQVTKNQEWNKSNNTYGFARALGTLIITLGLLVALYRIFPLPSMIASIFIFFMTLGTLSFLITTPEAWVPNLGGKDFGFPFLSGAGRLVIKDVVILGGAIITMSDSARLYLTRKKSKNRYPHPIHPGRTSNRPV
ncbi:DUF417 family protein [Mucilaginibacter aquaedulcis]|uniref:DUF417 family protein n=1 Tax=Mucilaginibacter aquaedulcis TaxID=1187081 RepID=UPI0025B45A98|nr:DUF417 family protein [Mucilaginibacter aquaedulcis]MDN3548883.1 DUF417 family protein [Mucilaginibacter aquaedulcis]